MKKNIVQDVIPPKKSIRNITLSNRSSSSDTPPMLDIVSRNTKTTKIKKEPVEDDGFTSPIVINNTPPIKVEPPSYDYQYDEPKKSSKKILYIAISILVVAGAFTVSAFFKSALIRVTPKQESKTLDESFTAKKDVSLGGLGFQVVTISKDVEKKVQAGGEEQVNRKAQGKIIIYNNYSSQSQKLVATTRFETPEGLIFRLPNAVTIPGKQTKAGKSVAGSIEVTVEADKSGTAYNVGLKDFTIPGFKGDPRFTSIYARSKSEMTGGFAGVQKVVSSVSVAETDKELEATLKSSLSKAITSQIPVNFILYPNSLSYKLEPTTQIESVEGETTTDEAILIKKGTANAIIFDKGALTRAILVKLSPEITDEVVKIKNLDSMEFAYSGTPDLSKDASINFTLNGSVEIVWVFDENKLKSDLLGVSKNNAKTVIGTYGTIKEAWVETYPFWNQTIPKDIEKVRLLNTLEAE